jgi:hypothetical protein
LWSSLPLENIDDWSIEFPTSVGMAFEQFLSRLEPDEQRAKDLLVPLAWAEGIGFPWDTIWPTSASILSYRTFTSDDIRWLLDRIGHKDVSATTGQSGSPERRLDEWFALLATIQIRLL